ncbi:MAG: B3/4 domain-containing protein [Promethearchaeota archaeon]
MTERVLQINFQELSTKEPLTLAYAIFENLSISRNFEILKPIEVTSFKELREKFTLENVKADPLIRAYRDFFWRQGIDPTKIRPAAEALIRRILAGKNLWQINTFVNAYNIASALTGITLGAYDLAKIDLGQNRQLVVRNPFPNEEFLGIGMDKAMMLKTNQIVVTDKKAPIAIYPYRDADRTKINLATKRALILAYGVQGISIDVLKKSLDKTGEIFEKLKIGARSQIRVVQSDV